MRAPPSARMDRAFVKAELWQSPFGEAALARLTGRRVFYSMVRAAFVRDGAGMWWWADLLSAPCRGELAVKAANAAQRSKETSQ